MGASIHLHVEVMVGGRWLHFNAPHVERDYLLFGRIAGVRNENIQPIARPRGLPPDISELTRLCYEQDKKGVHVHSETFITRLEWRALSEWYDQTNGTKGQGGYHGLDGILGYFTGNPIYCLGSGDSRPFEDARLVAWFDH